jgi:hypothetical protein
MHRFKKIEIEQKPTIPSFTANNLVKSSYEDYFTIHPNPNSTQCFPLIVTLEIYRFFSSPMQVDKQDFFLANARRVLVAKGFDKIMILGNPPEQELWIMRGRAEIICDARQKSNALFYLKGSNIEALRMYAEQYIFLFAIRNTLQLIKSLFSIYKRTNREAMSSAWEQYIFTIGVGDSFHLISKQIDRYSLRMASNINTLNNKKNE